MPDRDRQRLADSIDEASLLVWYASKKGLSDLDLKTIKPITDAKKKFKDNNLEPNDESLFWDSFRAIAKIVAPVTVDSIRSSYDLDSDRKSSAKKAIGRYRTSTLVILIILVLLQAYWFIGTSIKADIESAMKDQAEANLTEYEYFINEEILLAEENKIAKIVMQKQETIGRLKENKISGDDPRIPDLEDQLSSHKTELQLIREKKVESVKKMMSLIERKKGNKDSIDGNYLILDSWDFYTELLMWITSDKKEIENLTQEEKWKILQKEKRRAANLNGMGENEDKMLRISLLTTSSVLALFNQYLLPLLYGLLGSLAYILRTLTREIHDVTYTRNSNVRYRLRWPLGVLAGVTIGWFFNPETLELAGTITPLGLAFLAGYSVELLFVGLDRIISAFTGSQDGARHPSGM